jgi:hypothetical protein
MAADEKLRELARALPDAAPPTELALRRLRTRVMRDVATGVAPRERRVPSRAMAGLVLAAAVATGSWLVVSHRAGGGPVPAAGPMANDDRVVASEPLAGEVAASPGALWTHARVERMERVRLDEGSLHVHVRPQLSGERFLVGLPDGEIEVRGTTFDVSVEDGATRRVQVEEGAVELRLRGLAPQRLTAADTWTRTPAPRPAEVPPAAQAAAPVPHAPASAARSGPSASATAADDGTVAYAAAMEVLRAGEHAEAASAFHAFVLAYPRSPMAEDASFLEAVALARAGRADAAALAAEHHLASYPRSFHRKDAAVLVARAASSRGDCAKARAVLAPWMVAGADADVRAALRSCPAL